MAQRDTPALDVLRRALDTLRRHDPGVTTSRIPLAGAMQFMDADLAQALVENPHINTMVFQQYRGFSPRTHFPALFQEISTRENLAHVVLMDYDYPDRRQRCPASVATSTLEVIQQNPNVKRVQLQWLELSGQSVANLIDTAVSLYYLHLACCAIKPSEVSNMTAALNRSTSMEQLVLRDVKDTRMMLRILGGISLEIGASLKRLSMDMDASVNLLAICQAAAKVRIETLEFRVRFPGPQFTALVSVIPQMQAQGIVIVIIGDNTDTELIDAKAQILDAWEPNFDLSFVMVYRDITDTTIDGAYEVVPIFDNAVNVRVEVLSQRNKRYAEWQKNPDTLPQELWYEALGLSLQAGRESLYQSLHNAASKKFFDSFSKRKANSTP